MKPDEKTRARMYLGAVLPALEILSHHDPAASSLAAQWNGSILFRIGLQGPRTTLTFHQGTVEVFPSQMPGADIILFFPTYAMLTRLFTGKPSIPVLCKGLSKFRGLRMFTRLARHLEQSLAGHGSDVVTRSIMMLTIVARAIAILAEHEGESRQLSTHLSGVAEFRITNTAAINIDFCAGKPIVRTGHASLPDFLLEFTSPELFLEVAEDRVDVMAQACLERIHLKGDLHMGQTISVFLDKVSHYLQ
ncbi:MAG: SCP2 sterol-binding domain-containing protein [Desulfomonilia bacterium]